MVTTSSVRNTGRSSVRNISTVRTSSVGNISTVAMSSVGKKPGVLQAPGCNLRICRQGPNSSFRVGVGTPTGGGSAEFCAVFK